jgi:hypothetical protein
MVFVRLKLCGAANLTNGCAGIFYRDLPAKTIVPGGQNEIVDINQVSSFTWESIFHF